MGSKNIVVIGNSHALYSDAGIRFHFKDIYANLTLFAATGCMLAPPEEQISTFRKYCAVYVKELSEALRNWQYRIDIIIVLFGYARFSDPLISGDIYEDKTFRFMQTLYTNLTEIAKDVVFISNVSIHLWEDPPRKIQLDLKNGKRIKRVGSTVKVSRNCKKSSYFLGTTRLFTSNSKAYAQYKVYKVPKNRFFTFVVRRRSILRKRGSAKSNSIFCGLSSHFRVWVDVSGRKYARTL